MKIVALILVLITIASCNNKPASPVEVVKDDTIKSKYNKSITGSCSYNISLDNSMIYSFPADDKARAVINEIMEYTGLPMNFKLEAFDVENAAAAIECKSADDCNRYIFFNQKFMDAVITKCGTEWGYKSIMAHEIGHHLAGHTLDNKGSRPDTELDADKFSGYVLYKMGATLDEAQAAMDILGSETGSDTHPGKRARLTAISNGWYAAKDRSSKPIITTPSEEVGENNKQEVSYRLVIYKLECRKTASWAGNADEIQIYVDGNRVGEILRFQNGDSRSINLSVPVNQYSKVELREIDNYSANELLGTQPINISVIGMQTFLFDKWLSEYFLYSELVKE